MGISVGTTEGVDVAILLGNEVGYCDGLSDDNAVGETDRLLDGIYVGKEDGLSDDNKVGDIEG